MDRFIRQVHVFDTHEDRWEVDDDPTFPNPRVITELEARMIRGAIPSPYGPQITLTRLTY